MNDYFIGGVIQVILGLTQIFNGIFIATHPVVKAIVFCIAGFIFGLAFVSFTHSFDGR